MPSAKRRDRNDTVRFLIRKAEAGHESAVLALVHLSMLELRHYCPRGSVVRAWTINLLETIRANPRMLLARRGKPPVHSRDLAAAMRMDRLKVRAAHRVLIERQAGKKMMAACDDTSTWLAARGQTDARTGERYKWTTIKNWFYEAVEAASTLQIDSSK